MRDTYDKADVGRMIDYLIGAISCEFAPDQPLNIVGIRTRGDTLAGRIERRLIERGFNQIGRGVLDITLYRDDLSNIGPRPLVHPTKLEIQLDGKPCVLIDDVLFTGRSARAALNLLNDFGRPRLIRLAVLVDRNGRELPIQPDYAGITLKNIPRDARVNVRLQENDGMDEVIVESRA